MINCGNIVDAVQAGGPGTTAIVGTDYSGRTASHIVVMTNEGGSVPLVSEVVSDPARIEILANR